MRVQCDLCHLATAVVIICGDAGSESAACAECEESLSESHDAARRIPLSNGEKKDETPSMPCDVCKAAPATVFSSLERQVFCHGCDSAMHGGKSAAECPRFLLLGSCLPVTESGEGSETTNMGLAKPSQEIAGDATSTPAAAAVADAQPARPAAAPSLDSLLVFSPGAAATPRDDGLGLEWLAGMEDLMTPAPVAGGFPLDLVADMPRGGANGGKHPMPSWASPPSGPMFSPVVVDEPSLEAVVREQQQQQGSGQPGSPVSHLPEVGPVRKPYTTGARTQKSVARAHIVPFGHRKPTQKRSGGGGGAGGVRISAGAVDGSSPRDAVAVVMDTAGSSAAAAAAAARAAAASLELANGHVQQQTYARRCVHCGANKTPQWRAGPAGQKTLCNACGVRYKAGRLQPVVAFPPPAFSMPDGPTSSGSSGDTQGPAADVDAAASRLAAAPGGAPRTSSAGALVSGRSVLSRPVMDVGVSASAAAKSARKAEAAQSDADRRVRRKGSPQGAEKWGGVAPVATLA